MGEARSHSQEDGEARMARRARGDGESQEPNHKEPDRAAESLEPNH